MYDYVDGSAGTSFNPSTTAIASNTDVLCIGRNTAYTARDWNGYVGEVKISNVTRSSTWVTTEYNTTIGFSSFATSALVITPADIATGLIGWWNFNEGSGATALDSSGNANHGTEEGSPTYVAGKIGPSALNLVSSSSQYVSLPSGFATLLASITSFTFSGWVYCNSVSSWQRIFDFGTGTTYYMFLSVSGASYPRFAITTGGSGGEQQVTATDTMPTGAWTYIVVTLDALSTTARLFINGYEVASNTSTTLTPTSLGTTTLDYFGKSQYSDPYLNAYVNDFRFYSRALSTNDILQLYRYAGCQGGFFTLNR
jgi:hypothetical protein